MYGLYWGIARLALGHKLSDSDGYGDGREDQHTPEQLPTSLSGLTPQKGA